MQMLVSLKRSNCWQNVNFRKRLHSIMEIKDLEQQGRVWIMRAYYDFVSSLFGFYGWAHDDSLCNTNG